MICARCGNTRAPDQFDAADICETCIDECRKAARCAWPGCIGRRYRSRGYCTTHYHWAVEHKGTPRVRRSLRETAAEVEWIIGTDTPENVARRLGYSGVESLQKTLYRAKRGDLAMRLQTDKGGLDAHSHNQAGDVP